MSNQKCTIQRHWQHWACKAQDKHKTKTQHRKLKRCGYVLRGI